MGYDITNNDSTIILVQPDNTPNPGNDPLIPLPSTLPNVELVGQESISPVGDVVALPDTLPSPELIPVEGITGQGETVALPDQKVADPIVLTDGTEIAQSENNTIFALEKYYVHTQTVSASTWDVYHNLGKHPSIHIEDNSGNVIISQITHVDDNHAQIIFGRGFTGKAVCN